MRYPIELLNDTSVAIYHESELRYPEEAPFSPHVRYPEYLLKHTGKETNSVYEAVRQTLFLLKLDRNNFGTPCWDPLKEIVRPGDVVVIKPNFLLDRHDEGGDLFSIITHPSVLRAVIDYVYIALKGQGRIVIADAPNMDCDFQALLEKTNLRSIQGLYKDELGFEIEVYDLREFWYDVKKKAESAKAVYTKYRFKLPGDPNGNVVVPLDKDSLFYGLAAEKFYGADYDRREVIKFHHGEVQEYLMSGTILSADTVIFVPKLKVHKKVGVTLNVKGLVGTVVNKNCLVHYRLGSPSEGGDQFPESVMEKGDRVVMKLQRWASDMFLSHRHTATDAMYDCAAKTASSVIKGLGLKVNGAKLLDAGNWHGNDTTWRMAADLYRLFLYADQEGRLQTKPIRRMFSIIDGLTGGEGNGPLIPTSKNCGVLVAGFNLGAVDIVGARLMGFDYNKIRMLSYLVSHPDVFKIDINRIIVHSNQDEYNDLLKPENRKRYFNFKPPTGWEGFIEA